MRRQRRECSKMCSIQSRSEARGQAPPFRSVTKPGRHKQAQTTTIGNELTLDHLLLPLPALAGGDAVLLQALLALEVALPVGLAHGLGGGLGGDLFVTHGCGWGWGCVDVLDLRVVTGR